MKNLLFLIFIVPFLFFGCKGDKKNAIEPNNKRQTGICDIGADSKWTYACTYKSGTFSSMTNLFLSVFDTITINGDLCFKVMITSKYEKDTVIFYQKTNKFGTFKYFDNATEFIKYPVLVGDSFASGNNVYKVMNIDTVLNEYENCVMYSFKTDSTKENLFYQYNTGMVFRQTMIETDFGVDTIESRLISRN